MLPLGYRRKLTRAISARQKDDEATRLASACG